MIAIVSSAARERTALTSLCESRTWNAVECASIRDVTRLISRVTPKVILVRHQLGDGYSDDVIRALSDAGKMPSTKVMVLLAADASSAIEARQLRIGADCVQRDPIRSEVLLAYIEKYLRTESEIRTTAPAKKIHFAGTTVNAVDRTLHHGDRSVILTPREAMLVELLVDAANEVVTYETLYSEILGRRFRGDTSNMRVLLGKLGASVKQAGVSLHECVDVIPKTGYRYRPKASRPLHNVRSTPRRT